MKAQDPKHNSPRKKLATYYGLAILIIIFLNYVVFPLLFYPRPRQVAYSQFMRDVDAVLSRNFKFPTRRLNMLRERANR